MTDPKSSPKGSSNASDAPAPETPETSTQDMPKTKTFAKPAAKPAAPPPSRKPQKPQMVRLRNLLPQVLRVSRLDESGNEVPLILQGHAQSEPIPESHVTLYTLQLQTAGRIRVQPVTA